MNQPAILPENDESRLRRAFLHFEDELLTFEEVMKPLEGEMTTECKFELVYLGIIARSFFNMANAEVFGKAGVGERVGK